MPIPTGAISDKTFKTGNTSRRSLFFESAHCIASYSERHDEIMRQSPLVRASPLICEFHYGSLKG
jgi:hypothetical protein